MSNKPSYKHTVCIESGLMIAEHYNGWHYYVTNVQNGLNDLNALNTYEAYAIWTKYNHGEMCDLKKLTNSILVYPNQMKY